MNAAEYGHFVTLKVKGGKDIIAGLTPEKADLLHMGVLIAGEAGELLDVIKKVCIYGQKMDEGKIQHMVEELGDMEFGMEQVRQLLLVTRDYVLTHNMNKLSTRYVKGYSDKEAGDRNDKP